MTVGPRYPEKEIGMATVVATVSELIERGAPPLIRSDDQLEECANTLFRLTALSNSTNSQVEAIELLTLLIER
jgi:hypothetical protein